MKKKLTALALVVVMVAMLFTGLTMAYFTDNDKATNTFTVGDIDIDVIEKDEDGGLIEGDNTGRDYTNVVPGVEYDKEVTVKNTGDNKAYLRVTIEMPDYLTPIWAGNNEWTITGPVNGVYTATYNGIFEAGDTTEPCLKAVELKSSLTEDDFTGITDFKVIVNAEAIQADGFYTAEQAFAALGGVETTVTEVTSTTAQEALDAADEGDMIVLAAGNYEALTVAEDGITIVGKEGANVEVVNLNGAKNVILDGITFDAAEAVTVNAKSGPTAYVANITSGDAAGNVGAEGIIIRNCIFTGTPVDAATYVPICFEEQGRPTNRATNITVENCTFECNAFNYIRMNYLAVGTVTIVNNTFGGDTYASGHNTMNFTGNASDLIITGNKIYNWNVEKNAIGSSRQGSNIINVKITGNTFSNDTLGGEGGIIELKSSYTAANCSVDISGNTYTGELSCTDADAPIIKP